MYMADTLSRAYLTHSTPPVRQADVKLIDSVRSATAIETEDADAICIIAVSNEKREIKEATRDDQILQWLRTMIHRGWQISYTWSYTVCDHTSTIEMNSHSRMASS